MALRKHFKTLGTFLVDLVFPVSCLVCGAPDKFICDNCVTKLDRLDNQICVVCQKPAPFGKTHPDCVSRNTLDGLVSALSYSDPKVKRLIETFKYKFIFGLAPTLAQIIVNELQRQELDNYFSDFTIVPVPLHRNRKSWRGFNQAELIAKELSTRLNIPANFEIVTRTRNTTPQVNLDRDLRKSNIQNAFGINGALSGKKFLIIDDVATTGATLNELAKLLKKNGTSEVWAATVAHG